MEFWVQLWLYCFLSGCRLTHHLVSELQVLQTKKWEYYLLPRIPVRTEWGKACGNAQHSAWHTADA